MTTIIIVVTINVKEGRGLVSSHCTHKKDVGPTYYVIVFTNMESCVKNFSKVIENKNIKRCTVVRI